MNAYARMRETEPTPATKTPESIERVKAMRQAFKLQSAEFKRSQTKGAAVDAPLSPEKREDIRKMLALPDRGDATFEEREYRSKMAAKLED